jgi:hypothetical protein
MILVNDNYPPPLPLFCVSTGILRLTEFRFVSVGMIGVSEKRGVTGLCSKLFRAYMSGCIIVSIYCQAVIKQEYRSCSPKCGTKDIEPYKSEDLVHTGKAQHD